MSKIYLAHSISTTGEATDSIRVANNLRELGFDVYAAAENKVINDKSNDPTPIDIYNHDVSEILDSDIFIVNITGGLQDGTISEIGLVSGYNETLDIDEHIQNGKQIIAYSSNARLLKPQFYRGIPSAGANHLVLGMIEKHGVFVGGEIQLYEYLNQILYNKNKEVEL